MMDYTGTQIIGTETHRFSNAEACAELGDCETRIAWGMNTPKEWRTTTLNELFYQPTRKSDSFNIGLAKESELAFYILTQYPQINRHTPCEVGTACRCRAVRVDGYEYRAVGSKLHRKPIAELVA